MDPSTTGDSFPHLLVDRELREEFLKLREQSWCKPVLAFEPQTPCHLVGGFVRDVMLGRCHADIDLSVETNGRLIAEGLAEATQSRFVQIGGDRYASYRVIGQQWVVDIWDRQSQPLVQDLQRRDFTINSIACDLRSLQVVDPLGGVEDLAACRLKASSTDSFRSDPLRILRLARLAGELRGWRIDAQTASLAAASVADLADVSSQRVRTELKRSLHRTSEDQLFRILGRWSDLGVYPDLWIDRLDHSPDYLSTTLSEALDHQTSPMIHRLRSQLDRVSLALDTEVLAHSFILLSLEDPGRAKARDLLRSLRDRGLVSKKTAEAIDLVLRPRKLPQTEAEKRWFVHHLGHHWTVAIHLLGLLQCGRQEDLLRWTQLVEDLKQLAGSEEDLLSPPPPFMSGGDMVTLLGLEPGPQIKRLQSEVYKAQIEKRISSLEGARLLARKLVADPTTDSSGDDSAL